MNVAHRIVKTMVDDGQGGTYPQYHIREVLSDDDGRVFAVIENTDLLEEALDVAELEDRLKSISAAIDLPILDYDEVPEAGAEAPDFMAGLEEDEGMSLAEAQKTMTLDEINFLDKIIGELSCKHPGKQIVLRPGVVESIREAAANECDFPEEEEKS